MIKFHRVLGKHINDRDESDSASTALQGVEESPVEIELEPEMRYHSSFLCPISREQVSSDNPPVSHVSRCGIHSRLTTVAKVLLRCGHVILKRSLEKLTEEGKL